MQNDKLGPDRPENGASPATCGASSPSSSAEREAAAGCSASARAHHPDSAEGSECSASLRVTPAMIEAGVQAVHEQLGSTVEWETSVERVVSLVYRAMAERGAHEEEHRRKNSK